MARIFDRRTGRELARLTDEEFTQFLELFEEPVHADEPTTLDPAALDRLADAGATGPLLILVQEILAGREDLDIDWDTDPT
jgi:hypothetical protein